MLSPIDGNARGVGVLAAAGIGGGSGGVTGRCAGTGTGTGTGTGGVPAALIGSLSSAAGTEITPPQIEQRARTPPCGTLAGSTRNTERQSGHETFNVPPPHVAHPTKLERLPLPPVEGHRDGRS